jgi:hypothetical protein
MSKVDWRDAHCNLELTRDNVLEESMKKYVKLDPFKVSIFLLNINNYICLGTEN